MCCACCSAYSSLSRPFRKNVKHIVLVRPSKPLQAFLALLRPFVSRKAHRKVIKVSLPTCPRHASTIIARPPCNGKLV